MGRVSKIRAVGLLLLVSCLAVMLGAYQDRQQMARLEGNRLYSSNAVAALVNPAQALALVEELGGANRAFIHLDENRPIRAVAVGEPGAFRFPSKDGVRFGKTDGPQAVVGASVQTTGPGSRHVVEVAGMTVPVVGSLGAHSKSLLAYDVLVADKTIFARAPLGVVTFDGPDAPEAARAAFGEAVMPVRAGVADRTNIDVMSPIIFLLSGSALTLSALLSGVIIASSSRQWLKVSFILGKPRVSLLGSVSTQFLLVAAPAAGVALGLGRVIALPGGPALPGLWFMIGAMSAGFVAMHMSIWRSQPWK